MAKGIAFFFVMWALAYGLIGIFRSLNGSEKISVIKKLLYAGLMAGIGLAVVTAIVVLF